MLLLTAVLEGFRVLYTFGLDVILDVGNNVPSPAGWGGLGGGLGGGSLPPGSRDASGMGDPQAREIQLEIQVDSQHQQMERWKILNSQTRRPMAADDMTPYESFRQDEMFKTWDEYIKS